MYLSNIKIKGYRIFHEMTEIVFNKGLNVLVGENGSGKSSIIDAIRILLNEDEYSRTGIFEEDFYSSIDNTIKADKILIKGRFSELSENKKIEYITWLDNDYNAILNIEIKKKQDRRNKFKKNIWGGVSASSIFEWEALNDIQCVYLPPLRDAEKKLRAHRGSRLARLLINLSQDEIKEKRKAGELMDIERDVKDFNSALAQKKEIVRANELINESLKNALGTVFGQHTKIQFNDLNYERIVEALRLVFFPEISEKEDIAYRNLFENSLGYNNLIYLATILAEFEGLKDNYTSPRILLIEELEAHLHPQIQVKVLKYLQEQANNNDIQVIITTHSTTIASAAPIKNIICLNIFNNYDIKVTSIARCHIENKVENFLNRWLDTTRSTLLFSKGVMLVEGLAEAILIPKLAEIYLQKLRKHEKHKNTPATLEEAGISVINMNGIYFHYFMQLYRGYQLINPIQQTGETKDKYRTRLKEFLHKEKYLANEYMKTNFLPIRCVAITDNDPVGAKPLKGDVVEGNNPQLFNIKQLENMTDNCRVYTNLKTFEYDMALYRCNAKMMIEIILDNLDTDGERKKTLTNYLRKIDDKEDIDESEMAYYILKQIDASYIGKGLFAQLLTEKLDCKSEFEIPDYITNGINFVLGL